MPHFPAPIVFQLLVFGYAFVTSSLHDLILAGTFLVVGLLAFLCWTGHHGYWPFEDGGREVDAPEVDAPATGDAREICTCGSYSLVVRETPSIISVDESSRPYSEMSASQWSPRSLGAELSGERDGSCSDVVSSFSSSSSVPLSSHSLGLVE